MAACTWYGPYGRGRQRAGEQSAALRDECLVPPAAVLVGQRNKAARRRRPGRPPGVGEQHEGEQSSHLTLARQGRPQLAGEPDGLCAELNAVQAGTGRCGVPLVEHQVEHPQHGRLPCRPLSASSGMVNLVPLSRIRAFARVMRCANRRFRHQQPASDFGGGQLRHRVIMLVPNDAALPPPTIPIRAGRCPRAVALPIKH